MFVGKSTLNLYLFMNCLISIKIVIFGHSIVNPNTKLCMRNSQQILTQIWKYIIINVAYYMFRPLIVAIFREVFFEGYMYLVLP